MHPFFFTAILLKKTLNMFLGFLSQNSSVSQTMPVRVKKNLAENMISLSHIDPLSRSDPEGHFTSISWMAHPSPSAQAGARGAPQGG
jgi:hypothetical protein